MSLLNVFGRYTCKGGGRFWQIFMQRKTASCLRSLSAAVPFPAAVHYVHTSHFNKRCTLDLMDIHMTHHGYS